LVGWVAIVGWKMQRWTKANNIHPNGSLCCVPNFNKMTMKSPCQKSKKNTMGMGMRRIVKQMEKLGKDHNSWKMTNHDNKLKALRTSTYNTTQIWVQI
jgi:hypothetical protein